jgi:nucleoside-diphosphate-sugar epimerase
MNCFVTGASGFIGANLVHELQSRGHTVKALLRQKSDTRGLDGAQYDYVEGDLSDRKGLTERMRGADWCFHVAASYHLWLRDYAPMYAANVEGTRHVLEAAAEAGCSRIVYTSTVGCIGLPRAVNGVVTPTDESAPVFEAQMRKKVHYVIKPDYVWDHIVHLAKTQNDELLNTLQKGFKYIEEESFQSNFQGLFSEINLGSLIGAVEVARPARRHEARRDDSSSAEDRNAAPHATR